MIDNSMNEAKHLKYWIPDKTQRDAFKKIMDNALESGTPEDVAKALVGIFKKEEAGK